MNSGQKAGIFLTALASIAACPAQVVIATPPAPGDAPPRIFFAKQKMEGAVSVVAGQFSLEGKVVKGHPYTADAITETTQTLADGNHISRKETASVARDSEGRTRREQVLSAVGPWATSASSGSQKITFINDPVARVNYVLEPDHTARKMPELGAPMLDAKLKAEAKEAGAAHNLTLRLDAAGAAEALESKTEQLGAQTIEGVEAVGTRITTTIPAGQIGNELPIDIVSERWYSPELQATVMTKSSDPRVGETVFRLTNIQRAEPPASMFEVPADYKLDSGGYTIRTDSGSEEKPHDKN